VSFFETTIRALAGLLSAYALSKSPLFLDKARDIGDRLVQAFSHGGVWPAAYISLQDPRNAETTPSWRTGSCALSDIGSNILEFSYLSEATGDSKYKIAAESNMKNIMKLSKKAGMPLAPMLVNPRTPAFATRIVTMAAYADSYFEYLLKMYLLGGRRDRAYLDTWKAAMDQMRAVLVRDSGDLTYIATQAELFTSGWRSTDTMDHLSCFVGGMLALGAHFLPKEDVESWWMPTAKGITKSCYETYHRSPSGLGGEVNSFHSGKITADPDGGHYRLRPETLESLFYMHRLTGDPVYQDWSWEIFQAINKSTRTKFGFAKVKATSVVPPLLEDSQETFIGAETLKYALLIHMPADVLPLERFVFNTEAHPLPVQSFN